MARHLSKSISILTISTIAAALALSACSSDSSSNAAATPAATTPATLTSKEVVLVTHDSFDIDKSVLAAFTAKTGVTVKVVKSGDAGSLVNKAVLAKGNPQGDVLYGFDNTFLSRAEESGVLAPHTAAQLNTVDPDLVPPSGLATPIDRGDVCIDLDTTYFTENKLALPTGFDDLIKPEYKSLTVVENPTTSSPGLAFMLATIATKGENGWLDWWKSLKANDVTIVDDWDTAYYGQFSGGGDGKKPIVVSYATDPAAEIYFASDPKPTKPTVAPVESTCFGQVEYAGVLAGAKHPDAAAAFVDFMLTTKFQNDIPLHMFVYPVNKDATLPELFEKWAQEPETVLSLPAEDIAKNRDAWLRQWRDAIEG